MTERAQTTHLALALSGPLLWATHFFATYLGEAIFCADEQTRPIVHVFAAALTLCVLATLVVLQVRQGFRPPSEEARQFTWCVRAGLTGLSALAVLWTTIPLAMLPACASSGV